MKFRFYLAPLLALLSAVPAAAETLEIADEGLSLNLTEDMTGGVGGSADSLDGASAGIVMVQLLPAQANSSGLNANQGWSGNAATTSAANTRPMVIAPGNK